MTDVWVVWDGGALSGVVGVFATVDEARENVDIRGGRGSRPDIGLRLRVERWEVPSLLVAPADASTIDALREWQHTASDYSDALIALGCHSLSYHGSPNRYDSESGLACVLPQCLPNPRVLAIKELNRLHDLLRRATGAVALGAGPMGVLDSILTTIERQVADLKARDLVETPSTGDPPSQTSGTWCREHRELDACPETCLRCGGYWHGDTVCLYASRTNR